MLILLCAFQSIVMAQYSRVEYFVDTDPGFDKGISATLPTGDSAQFVVSVTSLTTGLHTLYVRVKNTNGHWSHTASRLFIKDELPVAQLGAAALVKSEYFIDTDPGFGKATAVTGIKGDSLSFTADITNISVGLHTLYVRTLNANGRWSHTVSRLFIKDAEPIALKPTPTVVMLEYFIDAVGYFGKGKSMLVTNPSMTVETDILADLKDVALGKHSFYVRAKDSNGQWGMIQKVDFEVINNTAVMSLSDNEKLLIYPNPTTDGFRFKGIESKAIVSIYSLNGECLLNKQFINNETISVSNLANGIYTLRIQTAEGVIERKLIKK